MGQVYQATDTKLNRQVALKILPEAFATDPDRLARFQREAQVLASLNHPGIAAIYGIEEAEDTRALMLELVEGPTLADRIAQGPIPVDEALPIAKQIAEALEEDYQPLAPSPPGSRSGWRWSTSPSARVVTGSVTPPVEATCMRGWPSVEIPNTIVSLDTTPEGDPSPSATCRHPDRVLQRVRVIFDWTRNYT